MSTVTLEVKRPYSRRVTGRAETFDQFLSLYGDRIERRGDCLIWTAHLTTAGYGRVRIDKRQYPVHRLTFAFIHGPIARRRRSTTPATTRRASNPDTSAPPVIRRTCGTARAPTGTRGPECEASAGARTGRSGRPACSSTARSVASADPAMSPGAGDE